MAIVAYGCRAIGLVVGTHLGESPSLRRFLDILPACAMGAVLGPSLVAMTLVQTIAVVVSALVYLASTRFLLALAFGTAVLLCERWITALIT
jgi:branched-subunit amino acid transport protein